MADIANKSELSQCFKTTAVAKEVMTAECADGIHQLQIAFIRLNLQVEILI
ncbi:MAG: hypothetical protein LBD88_04295 [Candidatus Peribacteria bacterium]|nr:hypothetical protein [Candidatus Peribacteria bacterium]